MGDRRVAQHAGGRAGAAPLRACPSSHTATVARSAYLLTVLATVFDFDGMAELWFDDLSAILQARRSPAWAASTADEAHFVDPSRSAYFVSEERQIL